LKLLHKCYQQPQMSYRHDETDIVTALFEKKAFSKIPKCDDEEDLKQVKHDRNVATV